MSWNEEKVNKLKELWGKSHTASQIAEIIGGISRNAVIGKAHRLNLSAKIKTRTATSNQNFENSQEQKNFKSKMLLQIHDELIFEVPKKDEKMIVKLIKEEMTSVSQSEHHSFSTPLTVDVNVGDNWGMLH